MENTKTQLVPLVEMKGVGKKFGRVRVLEGIDFSIYPGETHLLAGENGAGKSTLIKILGGIHSQSEGEVLLDGEPINPATPLEANDLGIAIIHQELSLIPQMSIMDNFRLGHYDTRFGFVSTAGLEEETEKILTELNIEAKPRDLVEDVSLSQQQLLEIAKATSQNTRIIVMDEPSSALSKKDTEILFQLIDRLKAKGCGIVYITHRMEEVERLSDRITVLRDGKFVSTGLKKEYTTSSLVQDMVGRELNEQFSRTKKGSEEEILQLQNFSLTKANGVALFKNISLTLHKGEILAIGGLQGSGASELFSAVFGAYGNRPAGELRVAGKLIKKFSPGRSIKKGVGLITNDRKESGLILPMSIVHNTTLASLSCFCRGGGWLQQKREIEATKLRQQELHIKAASLDMEIQGLSGGNQQKVIIGKWMEIAPKVILMDEPTRGVDIGAKWEIYQLLDELTRKGVAILLITSELPELLALSDRIIVMHRGEAVHEFQKNEATAEDIISAAMGNHTDSRNKQKVA